MSTKVSMVSWGDNSFENRTYLGCTLLKETDFSLNETDKSHTLSLVAIDFCYTKGVRGTDITWDGDRCIVERGGITVPPHSTRACMHDI